MLTRLRKKGTWRAAIALALAADFVLGGAACSPSERPTARLAANGIFGEQCMRHLRCHVQRLSRQLFEVYVPGPAVLVNWHLHPSGKQLLCVVFRLWTRNHLRHWIPRWEGLRLCLTYASSTTQFCALNVPSSMPFSPGLSQGW